MAKKMKRMITLLLALVFSFSMFASPALAAEFMPVEEVGLEIGEIPAVESVDAEAVKQYAARPGQGSSSSKYEWYEVYLQGVKIASGQGKTGNNLYLGRTYKAGITVSGASLTWYIRPNGGNAGNFGGTVNLNDYITVPEGFTVKDYEIAESSIEGVNSESNQYDNAIIKITIKTLYNEQTGEEIEVPTNPPATEPPATEPPATEPPATEPPVTEPPLVETKVTVNHIYKTFDIYTGNTVTDGTTSGTYDVTEGDTYTASPEATYAGNVYARQTGDEALTIVIVADAASNVINIEYLRTIDTTPAATKVTVNHKYVTFDVYTGQSNVDGTTSAQYDVLEGESFTATAVTGFNGHTYEMQTAASALTIEIVADAAENVVNIEYLRVIDTTPIDYTPVVRVEKTADKEVYEHGQTITWTITVKNVSEYTAYNVVVVDELTGDTWTIAELAPGAERTFTATTENAAPGSVKNTVVVSWDDNDEVPDEEEPNEIKDSSDEIVVSVNDPIPENYTPVISVVKTADKAVCKEGESITFTITVKNISDYPAYNVVIVDELAKGYWTIAELAPGAEQVFTVTMDNVAAGSVKNTVVVSWDDGDEIPDEEEEEVNEVTDEEIVTVEELVDYNPVLVITKLAGKRTYKVGEKIKWTISVKNISEHTAYNVVVVDEMTGDIWVIDALAAGEEKTFTVTTRATKAGTVTNAVVVTWEDNDEIADENEPEEPKTAGDEDTVKVEKKYTPTEPLPTEAPTEAPTEPPAEPQAQNDEIEIPDEEVPLASAPKTGDISMIWVALSGVSAAGMILLGKKKEEDEE